nr:retrovirus-related Pol polyprotein from transposon TNT 1-94 [Tanacetum cinerariifolium]
MEDLLYVKDYYLLVFTTEKPKNKKDVEWTIFHRQICGYIRKWVDDNVLNHICEETHARTLWNKLEQLYAQKTRNNKLFLIKQMMRLKYTDGSPITNHLNDFQGIINQLAGMGIKFEDEIQGLWLLGTLPDTWETFRTSLSNSARDGVITIELAKGNILNEEMRRKSQGSSSQSDVLVTERQGRSQSRGPSNKGNHRSSSSKGKFADVECYLYHKKGHTMKFYRQLKKENKKKNYNNQKNKHKKDDDGDDNIEVNTTTDEFFVCYDYDMVNLANDDSSWILDSGATCHVATQKDYYSSYTPGDFGVVRMGNTGLSRIAGIGEICLKFDTKMELVLHNVKHVPDMRLNIISIGLLNEDGYHNSSSNGLWKVTLGSLIVARGKRESKLYMTHPKISKSIVNVVDNDDMTELWNNRLGHMSENGMAILSKKNVLSGMHDINLKKCSHCLAKKQTRLAFKIRSPFRMENILDLVHYDVCGPMKTKTLGGCSYFVTFIDDHSRKVWVYTLNTKDQVLDVFKQFHALVERQTGKKLKCIQTDNEGEYIGPFDAYCIEHGMQHQKTPPKTPQLNGLAEWMNRTLVERVRCLLSHAGETIPQHNDDLIELDPVPPKHFDSLFGDDIQNDEEQGADDVDAQEQPNLDEDVHLELLVPDMPPFLPLRRSTRDHHPFTRYSAHEYVLLTDWVEPECYVEAMEDEHKKEWFEAMQDEMNFLHENNTFELVKQPKRKRVVKMRSIRVVLGLEASLDLEVKGKEDYVCRLQKSFYGLKQAPRQWYKKFESVIGITMLDFDDEDKGEEQNEEFILHSTNTMEYSMFGSYKDKEDEDNDNNSFEDLISPVKEHGKESVPFKVGEEVMEANTTPYLSTLKEPILSPIDDIRSKEDEEFFALSLYEDKCSNLLKEVEVTHIHLNPPQFPRVVINQFGADDSVFKNEKEQEKVSLVKDDHHVVERCHENSFSNITYIIVNQVHRKARVGVRKQRLSFYHGAEVSRSIKFWKVDYFCKQETSGKTCSHCFKSKKKKDKSVCFKS